MSSENLHAPRDRLSAKTITMHHAIVSLMEELEASDWYRQRADDTEDEALREILLHHMREEIEHAAMILEWLRRNDADFAEQLSIYLFTDTDKDITEIEDTHEEGEGGGEEGEGGPPKRKPGGFTIGSLRKKGGR